MNLGVMENGSGQVSSMRIGMYITLVVGAVVALSGAIGFFLALEKALEMVFAGEGIMALALGAKALQKSSEVKVCKSKVQTQETTTGTETAEGK
jgi:hypothetical protein